MDSDLLRVDRLAKRFDRELFARRNDGVIQVFQSRRKWMPIDLDGMTILIAKDEPSLVLSLTDNWSAKGSPVLWGYEPLYRKLSEVIRPVDEVMREVDSVNERVRESKERDKRRHFEDAACEARDMFKKTFNDVNTATMDKSKDIRRKIDRSIKWQS